MTLIIKRSNPEFNDITFLARPLQMIDKGDLRFHVNHFLVEDDGSAVSTNGEVFY